MDKRNFHGNYFEDIKDKVICNLYEYFREGAVAEQEKAMNKEVVEKVSTETHELLDEEDDFMMSFYMENLSKIEVPEIKIQEQLRAKKRSETEDLLKSNIESEVESYVQYCLQLNLLEEIKDNPTDECKKYMPSTSKGDKRIELKLTTYHKYFDVLLWWKKKQDKFAYMGKVVPIIMGKPTHNGFQERVFSRGTYKDDALRTRIKESNFEMSVLNSLNHGYVDEIRKKMEFCRDEKEEEIENEKIRLSLQEFYKTASKPIVTVDECPRVKVPKKLERSNNNNEISKENKNDDGNDKMEHGNIMEDEDDETFSDEEMVDSEEGSDNEESIVEGNSVFLELEMSDKDEMEEDKKVESC
jgi:hypothetical protein